MNRVKLIEHLSSDLEISKADADKFLSSFVSAIYENIRKDGVKISGLGTFAATQRQARVGRNPKTGEEIQIAAKWVPTFKAGTALKEATQ